MKWIVNFTFETDTDVEDVALQELARALSREFLNQSITNLTINKKETENGNFQTNE